MAYTAPEVLVRLTLPHIMQIENLSLPLGQTLRGLVAAIGTGWRKEHSGDGHHTDVTATSVTAPVLRSTGRLVGAAIWSKRPATADTMPLRVDATFVQTSGSRFYNVLTVPTNSASGATEIHGLDATGREPGERILIANIGNDEVHLMRASTSAPLGTRFMSGDYGFIAGETAIQSGGCVEVVYLRANNIPTAGYYWFIIGGERL